MSSPQPPYPSNQPTNEPYGQPGQGQSGQGQSGYGQSYSPNFDKQSGYQQPGAPPGYPQVGYGQPPNAYGNQYLNAVQKPTGWFVVNWLFFWPLAIYSLTSAWGNIDRALFVGDINGARYHADRVKKFGIIALCIGIGLTALWIILLVAVGVSTTSYCTGNNC